MCIFLADKIASSELVNKTVKIKDADLKIRPLIEKNKRVVISNVNPIIPHETVLNALKNSGITPISNINYIKASTSKPGRSHILSFRCQLYIKEEDENSLPKKTTYWIYLSTDSMHCYDCKQFGNSAKQCPKHKEFPELTSQAVNSNDHDKNMEISNTDKATERSDLVNLNSVLQPIKATKRLSHSITSESSSSTSESNPLEISQQYTDNIEGLIEIIKAYYPHAENTVMKARCTQLKKKLQGHASSNTESDQQVSEQEELL
ncbi:hypothetical protein TSAR_003834 [Trichomalopsis sarcophagae]|uniref:CCHC-type domain-containing protein n=1 Tax=Trichomalopsis sarcophagae TaxID=543379 RepID=A0A232EYB7_9HYME|nr:hypothetical protein TSAR_003834 [Trichomalopsis sarcophagae]